MVNLHYLLTIQNSIKVLAHANFGNQEKTVFSFRQAVTATLSAKLCILLLRRDGARVGSKTLINILLWAKTQEADHRQTRELKSPAIKYPASPAGLEKALYLFGSYPAFASDSACSLVLGNPCITQPLVTASN